eukprot:GILJ01021981.1.p1 GENE.GILJ01021981.1~~GILJ01021981.1.p1  ORF type:complete len:105 (-),score=10.88 GILJ01021981.1:16-330(-)
MNSMHSQVDFNKVLSNHETVVVDFYAPWCGPCKVIDPALDTWASTVKIVKVNVDEDSMQGVVETYAVTQVPTLLFIHRGQVADRMTGGNVQELHRLMRKIPKNR